MTKTDVMLHRELAGPSNMLRIFCDNSLDYFAGSIENYELIWDDVNECFYQLRPNVSQHTQSHSPVEITVVPYANIQSMRICANLQETIKFLQDRGFDTDAVNKALSNLKVVSGALRNTTDMKAPVVPEP